MVTDCPVQFIRSVFQVIVRHLPFRTFLPFRALPRCITLARPLQVRMLFTPLPLFHLPVCVQCPLRLTQGPFPAIFVRALALCPLRTVTAASSGLPVPPAVHPLLPLSRLYLRLPALSALYPHSLAFHPVALLVRSVLCCPIVKLKVALLATCA